MYQPEIQHLDLRFWANHASQYPDLHTPLIPTYYFVYSILTVPSHGVSSIPQFSG